MIITAKQNQVIRDLSIIPTSVQRVGDAYMGVSASSVGYVWRYGEIYDFVPGMSISMPTVNARTIQRISGMNFAGENPEGHAVFMSSSSSQHLVLPKEQPDVHAPDMATLKQALGEFAAALSNGGQALLIASQSAARVYSKYVGKKVSFDDANDEYDLELEKGDMYSLVYLNRDRYELRLKDEPRMEFIIRGHQRAANLIGQTEYAKQFGTVGADKNGTFTPVGEAGRNIATPIQMQKGTVVYMSRKKHYLPQNLVVPLEKILAAGDLDKLLSSLKPVQANKAIAKGKLVGVKLPPLPGGTKIKSEAPIPRTAAETVYGAYFPVSASQPNRSRVIFGKTILDVQKKAREAVLRMAIPTDYALFQSTTSDELYDLSKGGAVIIRATGLLQGRYPASKKISMGYSQGNIEYHEPTNKATPPPLTTPAVAEYTDKVVRDLYRLITEGYFNTGLHLSIEQPKEAISFTGLMDAQARDQITGVARRIAAYLKLSGAELPKSSIRVATGRQRAEIRFNLPRVSGEQSLSIARLQEEGAPTLNAPIYSTIKPKQPTVEITAFNIHTGYVTVRTQRGPELYSEPYDTLYSNIERKTSF